MSKTKPFIRPPFEEANRAWKVLLQQRGFPADLLWVFGDNLCFEDDPSHTGGFRIGFQTVLTKPPPEAEQIAYEYFSDFEAPLVFYRLGSSGTHSVCVLLCDKWLESKVAATDFSHRPEWGIGFRPGNAETLEEITEPDRWKKRALRERPLHELDFCMDLRSIHEILAHGRVLSTYEHYALRLLHIWRRIFDETGHIQH
jgi:hypothetical protein